MLLALGWTTPSQAKTVYLKPNANWLQSNARFALYMFGGSGTEWADFTLVDAANNIYKATFDDNRESMIFVRMNPATTENNWNNKWNQSGDLAAPANDNELYTLADGQSDGATVGNGLTITSNYTEPQPQVVAQVVASGVVAFGVDSSNRSFITDTPWVGGQTSFERDLSDGTHMLLNFTAGNASGKFFKAQIAGDWTNTNAVNAMNSDLGTEFEDADFAVGSTLPGIGPGPGDSFGYLNLTFDADVNLGDVVTLYVTVLGQNCALDNLTITGLDEMATWYALGSSNNGFVSTTTFSSNTFSPDIRGLTLVKITGKVTDGKLVRITSTTMQYPNNPNSTTTAKIGFQIAAYKVEKPAALSGTVKDSEDTGIANATITLKAANNVEYSGTTDATGAYSINVYEADLDFTATVEASGYLTRQFALNMGGASFTKDVIMYKKFGIVGSLPGLSWGDDLEMTQSTVDPNIFTAELTDVSVTAGDYAFKLRADEHYAGELAHGYEYPSSGNIDWTIHTTGVYNYKFTFNWATEELTFERPIMLSNNTNGIADLNWVDITLDRTFKAGWNAVVLPFYLSASEVTASFGSNAEVAYYAGDENVNGDVTVTFDKRNEGDIVAGVPYLLWIENEVSGLKFTKDITATQYNTAGTAFDFVGVYASTVVNAGDYFVYGGQFVKAGSNNTVLPFRAYLQSKGTPARSVTFVIGDDVATDINGLTVEHDYANDAIYNLNGQRVENPAHRGVYIINGRKVVKM